MAPSDLRAARSFAPARWARPRETGRDAALAAPALALTSRVATKRVATKRPVAVAIPAAELAVAGMPAAPALPGAPAAAAVLPPW